jgi:putative flippase GtrA
VFSWAKKTINHCYQNRVLRYVFFGGLTTLVNLGVYYLLRAVVPSMAYTYANIISVSLSILFAYFTNSRYVFLSKSRGFSQRFPEFMKFVGARLSTMIIEVGGVWLMCEKMGIADRWGKLIVQFIVLALNYIFSKFLVFTRKRSGAGNTGNPSPEKTVPQDSE